MRFWQKRKSGFTLIELMISVALMLVLVSSVVMVFNHTTTVFNVSEAKMSIYQNARAAMEIMAKELTSADNTPLTGYAGGDYDGFNVAYNGTVSAGGRFQFKSNTFWITGSSRQNGMAVVDYYLQNVPGYNVRNLMRRVRRISITGSTTTLVEVSNSILAQYVANDNTSFQIDCFEYDAVGSQWKQYPTTTYPQTSPGDNKLPGAVRITIKFTDRESRIVRVLSRTV